MNKEKYEWILIVLIILTIFGSIIFRSMQMKKEKEAMIESERIYPINKNIQLLKSGKICKEPIKRSDIYGTNPKLNYWIYNNITNEACMIITVEEQCRLAPNSSTSQLYYYRGICNIYEVQSNYGTLSSNYTRYATQNEVDKTIKSVESLLK
jgi:hypothetical protein